MSDRPLDWSVLGYDADPVPGDPVVVRAGGEQFLEMADWARGRYRVAGEALVEYAFAHDTAQQITVQALYAAITAQADAATVRLLAVRRDEMAGQFRAAGDADEAPVSVWVPCAAHSAP